MVTGPGFRWRGNRDFHRWDRDRLATRPSSSRLRPLDRWGKGLFVSSLCALIGLYLYVALGGGHAVPVFALDAEGAGKANAEARGPVLIPKVDRAVALLDGPTLLALDAEGRAAKLGPSAGLMDLPVVTGVSLQDQEALRSAAEALEQLRKSRYALYGRLSELHYERGAWIAYLVDYPLPVLLGSGPPREKLELLAQTLPILEKEEDLRRVAGLDLRFDSQIVVRYAGDRTS